MEGEWNYVGEVGPVHFLETPPVQQKNIRLLLFSVEHDRHQDPVVFLNAVGVWDEL